MTDLQLSGSGRRGSPDPMAAVFMQVQTRAGAFAAETGQPFLSLAAGTPASSVLPAGLFVRLTRETLSAEGPGCLNYSSPRGIEPLREAFHQLLVGQGVRCRASDLLITGGGMEALSLAALVVLDPGDVVLTEGPGFPGLLSVLALLGARVIQVETGDDALTPDALAGAIELHRPKLVSLMPDHLNPTGAVMPLEHRQAIAQLLRANDVLALEDGTYTQLRFDGVVHPPLQSLAPERVLYATSVSKIFAPAARIGALVAPRLIVDRAADVKSAFNMQASTMHQAVTARFLDAGQGHLSRHLDSLRSTYRHRRDAMLEALDEHFGEESGYRWTKPTGGMFVWLTAPEGVDLSEMTDAALARGVAYVPGTIFYLAGTSGHSSARLNFASITAEGIREAIKRLALTLGVTRQ